MEYSEEVAWSKNHFRMLADGGMWGVPRSGLMFQRRGDELHLIGRMPHDPKMPISAEELDREQRDDFAVIKRRFEDAAIPVKWLPA